MDVTITAPILEPVWIGPDEYDRIGRLSGILNKPYSTVVSEALKWYEDCLTIADKLCAIEEGGADDSRG